MPLWKKTIFVNAIRARMKLEQRTAENLIQSYPKLTYEEMAEILDAISDI